jgi:hypothetical protein
MATDTKTTNVGPDELTSKEFQRLLQIAEALEKDAERNQTRLQWYFFSLLLVVGVCGLGILGVGLLAWQSTVAEVLACFILGLIGGAFLTHVLVGLIRVRRLLARDRIAVYEIIAPLRELERAIAERNNLSALERLELRVRLARFDVDTKYRSQYWPLFKE